MTGHQLLLGAARAAGSGLVQSAPEALQQDTETATACSGTCTKMGKGLEGTRQEEQMRFLGLLSFQKRRDRRLLLPQRNREGFFWKSDVVRGDVD